MSTRPRRAGLDRANVVAAAIAIADGQGLAAASMRGVAERLTVTPMALYKHVANHAELVDAMLDRVIDGIPSPRQADDWRATIRARILAARATLARHPWAREAIETRTLATPTVLGYMDSLMDAMFAGGLSADLVHHAMHALSTRMWGFTRDVLPTPTPPDDPEERVLAMAAFAERYPAIVRMATTAANAGVACDTDAEFVFALDLLLDGVERMRVSGWAPTATGAAER